MLMEQAATREGTMTSTEIDKFIRTGTATEKRLALALREMTAHHAAACAQREAFADIVDAQR